MDKLKSKLSGASEGNNVSREIVIEITWLASKNFAQFLEPNRAVSV